MELLNVEIISKEIIKPSSPTPNHHRNIKLSSLDQNATQVYVPLIFFYQNDQLNINPIEVSRLLKQSLSNILTLFPPLAGRVEENSHIDCNDVGAEFIEAEVHASLIQVIEEPLMEQLQQLLPVETLDQTEKAILSVKINFFDCGGIALAVCLSHKIADAASLVLFINAWAASCRKEGQVIRPSFDLSLHFPPTDLSGSGVHPDAGLTKEKITTKRLVFNKENIAKLKQVAASGEVKNPTTVEVVSAFIWRHFINSTRAKKDTKNTLFTAAHVVNLRPRTIPPIPEHTFGNCLLPCSAFLSKTEDRFDLVVSKLRSAISEINDDYIKNLQKGDQLTDWSEMIGFFEKDIEICIFSSWWRFPIYEVDFSWGKPIWVCPTTMPYKNLVILMSNPSEDGIEAWINLPDHDLNMLETLGDHCSY